MTEKDGWRTMILDTGPELERVELAELEAMAICILAKSGNLSPTPEQRERIWRRLARRLGFPQ